MPRKLMLALVLVAVGATRSLGAQTPAGGVTRGVTIDPWISQALREQLSAGYGQRREPSSMLQRFTPDRPLVRQVPVVPESIAELVPNPNAMRCPMPVAKADARALAPMPVARADSTRLEKMPVARSGCVNPLNPR